MTQLKWVFNCGKTAGLRRRRIATSEEKRVLPFVARRSPMLLLGLALALLLSMLASGTAVEAQDPG